MKISSGKKPKDTTVELNVAEAYQEDVGRGIARLDSKTMNKLDIEPGDIILIKGTKETLASVRRARPEDSGLDLIRIDGILRKNAGTSLGEKVKVKPIQVSEATKVVIAPTENVKFSGDVTGFFHEKLLQRPLMRGMTLSIDIYGNTFHFIVTNVLPKGYVIVTRNTQVVVSETSVKETYRVPNVTYEDIGGLKEEIEMIREMVELPMKHPELFERLGIEPPKGVLLVGPPGTGKTLLAKAVANESDAAFYSINGPEIMSKYYGESERQLREIFEEAEKNAPSIIFIDEIDSIAPKRDEVSGEVERRIVAQLLTLMDGLKSRGQVVVIGATNRPNALDPALRRPGRFDREIVINLPNTDARKEILQIHTRGMPLANDVNLDRLAELTHGFSGADLEALAKEAALKALRRYIPELKNIKDRIPKELLEKIIVKMEHFLDALKSIEPSGLREVIIQKPKVKWEDIGGLKEAKRLLQEMVELPLKHPEVFEEAGIKPPKGVLLVGPPGTGKTLLAKAVANEAEANFIAVKGPELISKWVGESEKHIREIFKKARQSAPTIIFFDEFDSLAPKRSTFGHEVSERVVNQLLTELDGIEELSQVVVIAATNRVDLIDPALLRPGRFDYIIELQLPNKEEREEIFKVHTKRMPLSKEVELKKLAELTDKFSGAEIEAVCREAAMKGIRAKLDGKTKKVEIKPEYFEESIKEIKARKEQIGE